MAEMMLRDFCEGFVSVFTECPWRRWGSLWAWIYGVTALLVGVAAVAALLGAD